MHTRTPCILLQCHYTFSPSLYQLFCSYYLSSRSSFTWRLICCDKVSNISSNLHRSRHSRQAPRWVCFRNQASELSSISFFVNTSCPEFYPFDKVIAAVIHSNCSGLFRISPFNGVFMMYLQLRYVQNIMPFDPRWQFDFEGPMTCVIGNGPTKSGCDFFLPASALFGSRNADDFTRTLSSTLNGFEIYFCCNIFSMR